MHASYVYTLVSYRDAYEGVYCPEAMYLTVSDVPDRERRTCWVGFIAELPDPRITAAALRKDTTVVALEEATAAAVLTLTAATQR